MRTPWHIYDPNGDFERETGHKTGYRPVWIHDADGKELLYVGNGAQKASVYAIAQKIVGAVNARRHSDSSKKRSGIREQRRFKRERQHGNA